MRSIISRLSRKRSNRQHQLRQKRRRIHLIERLEKREMLAGDPIAVDDNYQTDEDSVLNTA